jgi:hypothetical protein
MRQKNFWVLGWSIIMKVESNEKLNKQVPKNNSHMATLWPYSADSRRRCCIKGHFSSPIIRGGQFSIHLAAAAIEPQSLRPTNHVICASLIKQQKKKRERERTCLFYPFLTLGRFQHIYFFVVCSALLEQTVVKRHIPLPKHVKHRDCV